MFFESKHKIGTVVLACICMAWIAWACQDDRYVVEEPGNSISFRVVSDAEMASRGSSSTFLEVEGQELSLVLTVEDNTDSLRTKDGVAARGAAYDNADNRIPSMFTTAIYSDDAGNKPYFTDEKVTITAGKGASGHYWPEDGTLSFFAYACSKTDVAVNPTFAINGDRYTGTFEYTLPAASTESAPKDATAQPDLVFAITPNQTKASSPDVPLTFHHALSAIVFKVGNMPSDVTLKAIAISGVYSSGSCSMEAYQSTNKELDIKFTWSYDADQQQNGVYTESLNEVAEPGNQMGGPDAMFMMLPQEMGKDTKLILTFEVDGVEQSLEKAFKDVDVLEWEADHKYTFKIGLPEDISVEVSDEVVNLVKRNLTIQNTGDVSGYIRAAIVGYWVNEDGGIESPWLEDDGTFVWGKQWSNYWKKGTDGFYYHLAPVSPQGYTGIPLFDTYTLNSVNASKYDGLTLELSIVAQIIPVSLKSSWPELNGSTN